jgi:hypothetical protein
MRRLVFFLGVFLFVLAAARQVSAAPQSKGTSTFTGVVIGPDDKPVPHASISYQSSSGSVAPHVVRADAHGNFTITKLHADAYDLRATGRGVFSQWEKNVNLKPGQTKTLTLRLIYAKKIPKAYVKSNSQQPQTSPQSQPSQQPQP